MRKFLAIVALSLFSVLVVFFLPHGFWASIGDLPAHPLVVHAVVVLLPLLALGLLLLPLRMDWLRRLHRPLLSLLAVATVSVLVAKSSGDSLSAAVGLPELHAEWGNNLVPLAIALLVFTSAYFFLAFYLDIPSLERVLRILVGLLSVVTIAVTILVGHSGAEAVWKDRYAAAKVPLALSLDRYTVEEVAAHNTATDCWTIVNGFVYDVTTFAGRHPAGSEAIKEMCGVNATEDYLDEHDGQREPSEWLETLKIGRLK
jgi:hypothetical protein